MILPGWRTIWARTAWSGKEYPSPPGLASRVPTCMVDLPGYARVAGAITPMWGRSGSILETAVSCARVAWDGLWTRTRQWTAPPCRRIVSGACPRSEAMVPYINPLRKSRRLNTAPSPTRGYVPPVQPTWAASGHRGESAHVEILYAILAGVGTGHAEHALDQQIWIRRMGLAPPPTSSCLPKPSPSRGAKGLRILGIVDQTSMDIDVGLKGSL